MFTTAAAGGFPLQQVHDLEVTQGQRQLSQQVVLRGSRENVPVPLYWPLARRYAGTGEVALAGVGSGIVGAGAGAFLMAGSLSVKAVPLPTVLSTRIRP